MAICVRKALQSLDETVMPGEIVVSDNGSADQSVLRAREAGARVVHCPIPGYGAAIRYGVEHANGQYLVVGDADNSYDFSDLGSLIRPLEAGADVVIGNRFRGRILPGAMPWKNRYIGNPVLSWVLNRLFHTGVGDPHCGLRSFTREAWDRMRSECDGMEFASEMVVKAAKLGLKIVEVPITYYPDGRGGQRSKLRPWRDGWRHLKFLLMFSPLHLFLVPGASMLALGLLLVLALAGGPVRLVGLRFDVHWMVLGALLVLIGVQVIQFGICARLYTVTHRFPEKDRLLEWLRARVSVETGLLTGAVMFLTGLAVDGWILSEWLRSGFGALERVRPALVATTLMAVGIQTVFFAFLAGIIGSGSTQARSASEGQQRGCAGTEQDGTEPVSRASASGLCEADRAEAVTTGSEQS